MPGAFFYSRDNFKSREKTQEKFRKYSFFNSLIFSVVGNAF